MASRLHPAAIAVYAVDALRQGAFPLLRDGDAGAIRSRIADLARTDDG